MAADVDSSHEAVLKQLRVLNSTSASAQERVRALDQLALIGKARVTPLDDPVPLVKCLRWLLTSKTMWTRCAALRVIRIYAADNKFMRCVWQYKLDYFILRSMDRYVERDKKLEKERDMAFRVVGRCIEIAMAAYRATVEAKEVPPTQPKQQLSTPLLMGSLPTSPILSSLGATPPSAGDSLSRSPDMRAWDSSSVPQKSASSLASPTQAMQQSHPIPEIPRGLVHRLALAAESPDDAYQRRALAMLKDLLICSPTAVARGNGVRGLLAAVIDPELHDLHPSIIQALLYVLDKAETRECLRLPLELYVILAPFTDKLQRDPTEYKKRLQCSKENVLIFLRSWVGLFFLASDPRGLRPIIDTLRLPGPLFRKMIIFDMLHQAIRAAAPHRGIPMSGPWTDHQDDDGADQKGVERSDGLDDSMDNDRRDEGGEGFGVVSDDGNRRVKTPSACAGYTALDMYLGTLLLVLDHAGLTDTLIALVRLGMGGEDHPEAEKVAKVEKSTESVMISQAAAQLLQTFLLLTDTIFPGTFYLKLYNNFDMTIANLRAQATESASLEVASKVSSMTTSLFHKIVFASAPRKEVRLDSIKLQMSSNMEDTQFRILLNDSLVTTTKDWNRWNCETILFLIKGPLRLHSRLQEALKTKFFKRLLTFIKPRRKLFADLRYKEEYLVYSDVACNLIELLLKTKDGANYLSQSGLLEEIRSILTEVTAVNVPEREKILCKERIMYFMSREYLKIIGKCSESPLGVELLQNHNIFNSLQLLMEKSKSRDRDDICHQILKHLNFSRVGNHPVNPEAKAIFSNAMTQGSRPIRLFATLQLRNSFRLGYKDSIDWALDLLVAQLSDSWREVAKGAYEIINEWCGLDDDVLDRFIAKRPGLQTFSKKEEPEDHANRLLLRMLTREAGFTYLHELGVVQKQLHEWASCKAIEWTYTVERSLDKVLAVPLKSDRSFHQGRRRHRAVEGFASMATAVLPPHYYGEMCKTHKGCEFFAESNILNDLVATILGAIEEESSERASVTRKVHDTPSSDSDKEHDDLEERVGLREMRQSVRMYFEDEGDTIHDLPEGVAAMGHTMGEGKKEGGRSLPRRGGEFDQAVEGAERRYASPPSKGSCITVSNSLALRSALWAIGHIASSATGFSFLTSQACCRGLLQRLLRLAVSASCISLKGTLIGVFSIIGMSEKGRELLSSEGWNSNKSDGYISADGVWYGSLFSYPTDLEGWASVPYTSYSFAPCDMCDGDEAQEKAAEEIFRGTPINKHNVGQYPDRVKPVLAQLLSSGAVGSAEEAERAYTTLLAVYNREQSKKKAVQKEESAFDAVLRHVRAMANPVLFDTAAKSLKKIRQQDSTIFQDPSLAFEIHSLLSKYRYRGTARRFLYELVDHAVLTHKTLAQLDGLCTVEPSSHHAAPELPPHVVSTLQLPSSPLPPAPSTPTHPSGLRIHLPSPRRPDDLQNPNTSSPRGCPRRPTTPRNAPDRKPSAPLQALLQGLEKEEVVVNPAELVALIDNALQGPESLVLKQVLAQDKYMWTGEGFGVPLSATKALHLASEFRKYTGIAQTQGA